jgi:hypothetical protein
MNSPRNSGKSRGVRECPSELHIIHTSRGRRRAVTGRCIGRPGVPPLGLSCTSRGTTVAIGLTCGYATRWQRDRFGRRRPEQDPVLAETWLVANTQDGTAASVTLLQSTHTGLATPRDHVATEKPNDSGNLEVKGQPFVHTFDGTHSNRWKPYHFLRSERQCGQLPRMRVQGRLPCRRPARSQLDPQRLQRRTVPR